MIIEKVIDKTNYTTKEWNHVNSFASFTEFNKKRNNPMIKTANDTFFFILSVSVRGDDKLS